MKNIVYPLAAVLATASLVVHAQENDFGEEDVAAAAQAVSAQKANQPRIFATLPGCSLVSGQAEVLKPGEAEWRAAEEDRRYPLGSLYRTVGEASSMTVTFGVDCSVRLVGTASFGTRALPLDAKNRVISLKNGTIIVSLPRNLPEGAFSVSAPGFTVDNLAGESRYTYSETGDGDEAVIRCITGTLSVSGRHFEILSMRAANEVRIRTSQDVLFSGIYGTLGDYTVRLDQGLVETRDIETGISSIEPKFLDWKMSPQTAVRIHRAKPAIGENMAVSVMTFDAAGKLNNRCVFAENRYEVNSGELAPVSKENRDELTKKAAEATDTETVEVDVEDEDGEAEEDADAAGSDDDEDDDEEEDF